MCWHDRLRLGCDGILRFPETCHGLPLRVEIQTGLAIKVVRSTARHALLVPSETEHGQWYRNGHVDTQLTDVHVLLELGRRGSGASEDGGAVAVGVVVDESDCVVDCGGVEADEDRAKDLFGVAFHVGLDIADYSGSDLEKGTWSVGEGHSNGCGDII